MFKRGIGKICVGLRDTKKWGGAGKPTEKDFFGMLNECWIKLQRAVEVEMDLGGNSPHRELGNIRMF